MKSSVINRFLAALIFVLGSLQLVASGPENGRLTGQLLDGETQEPIPFANVVLLRADDHSFVRSVATDAEGTFKFNNIPLGDYTVRTTVLGYKSLKPVVSLSMLQGRVALGSVEMQPLMRGLAVRPSKKDAPIIRQAKVASASRTLTASTLTVR
ncbi:hypothetical protein GCM10011375_19050 [Hymenobacter qilianensis]|uniref:Uncharacterized protein n=1 Tax=Hymenobacter qilianensis TaxID=1385715 RepID=A0ACB5PRA8_9BACT|nr:carboxypeptidase regulatory-like domain-containing protein [Hymenobacter qilianensis]GGF64358.1 hypothetical protein GCM10011375_19050 [Hymenobacter qilianensis]